ncbi:MAG: triose-phosphate isomerase, partial [Candidatus Omnitrophota bacterium]|nr:triose-phosphate isomerase [Candidatus Omnitrophota bacterium]
KAALKSGLIPIVCVGEVLEEREQNKTTKVVTTQMKEGLEGVSKEDVKRIIIAYEPVWAIGTGKTATPGQAQEVHQLIRQLLTQMCGEDVAQRVRIQYGGSVKPENIAELMAQPDIDGALVGGASLKVDSFVDIIKNSCVMKT